VVSITSMMIVPREQLVNILAVARHDAMRWLSSDRSDDLNQQQRFGTSTSDLPLRTHFGIPSLEYRIPPIVIKYCRHFYNRAAIDNAIDVNSSGEETICSLRRVIPLLL
jgi:hypothetical protein